MTRLENGISCRNRRQSIREVCAVQRGTANGSRVRPGQCTQRRRRGPRWLEAGHDSCAQSTSADESARSSPQRAASAASAWARQDMTPACARQAAQTPWSRLPSLLRLFILLLFILLLLVTNAEHQLWPETRNRAAHGFALAVATSWLPRVGSADAELLQELDIRQSRKRLQQLAVGSKGRFTNVKSPETRRKPPDNPCSCA